MSNTYMEKWGDLADTKLSVRGLLDSSCDLWCARTDSNRQPSDPKMSMRGVHGVLMKPKGLDPLRIKSRETAKGPLSFSRTADHLTDLIFL